MKQPFCKPIVRTAATCFLIISITAICPSFCLAETNEPWPWSDGQDDNSLTLILLGDYNVQKRNDPADALVHALGIIKWYTLKISFLPACLE